MKIEICAQYSICRGWDASKTTDQLGPDLHGQDYAQAGQAPDVYWPNFVQDWKRLQDGLRPKDVILLTGYLIATGCFLEVKEDDEAYELIGQDCMQGKNKQITDKPNLAPSAKSTMCTACLPLMHHQIAKAWGLGCFYFARSCMVGDRHDFEVHLYTCMPIANYVAEGKAYRLAAMARYTHLCPNTACPCSAKQLHATLIQENRMLESPQGRRCNSGR